MSIDGAWGDLFPPTRLQWRQEGIGLFALGPTVCPVPVISLPRHGERSAFDLTAPAPGTWCAGICAVCCVVYGPMAMICTIHSL